jgi:DNA-binding transcriptional ArsR family regulator
MLVLVNPYPVKLAASIFINFSYYISFMGDLSGADGAVAIKGRDLTTRRLLRFEEIKEICKENCPCELEKLLSKIELKTGLTRARVREHLIPLYDSDFIAVDNDNMVRLKA